MSKVRPPAYLFSLVLDSKHRRSTSRKCGGKQSRHNCVLLLLCCGVNRLSWASLLQAYRSAAERTLCAGGSAEVRCGGRACGAWQAAAGFVRGDADHQAAAQRHRLAGALQPGPSSGMTAGKAGLWLLHLAISAAAGRQAVSHQMGPASEPFGVVQAKLLMLFFHFPMP